MDPSAGMVLIPIAMLSILFATAGVVATGRKINEIIAQHHKRYEQREKTRRELRFKDYSH